MTFADISAGSRIFIDANCLIYHFSPHPTFGPSYHSLIALIENQTIVGYSSTHVLCEVAHALMIVEAISLPGWTTANVKGSMRRAPPGNVVTLQPGTRGRSMPHRTPLN
jgi:hypothetical protein